VDVGAGAEVGCSRAGVAVVGTLLANDRHVARRASRSSLSRCETMAS